MPDLAETLRRVVGGRHLLVGEALEDYRHDGTFMEGTPLLAVRPGSTQEVADVVRSCAEVGMPVVARGAGSSLVGGPVPVSGGVVLHLDRLDHLEIDSGNLCAVAGAGVITGRLQEAAAEYGLMYPPDPASADMSTIGGNVACNSGGMSCLKYGVTADYVIGMTVVLADGQVVRLGGKLRKRSSGYRLMSLFVGSEGTLGVVTEVILKLVPLPRHRSTAMVGYDSIEEAAEAVSRLLVSGHLPAGLELMDRHAVAMVGAHLPAGFKTELEAVLIVEQDGSDPHHVLAQLSEMVELLRGVDNRVAQTEAERAGIWKARRQFGHVLLANRKNFFAEDVAVPVSQIAEMVRRFTALATRHGVTIATVGHAGDGNLHPCILFTDAQRPLVGPIAGRIFRDALELGGSISAEHGLGALKRDYAELEHGPEAMELMGRLKRTFDPKGILNPHKVFPEGPADDAFLERQPGWGTKLASGRDRAELGA
ncbi:MAG TPA: FAD-linked oxidase C-terminal domain-containing protein [Candidatus Dormibacteraeota bacterium]|nr:FAD-linked oxidase C-terminal domain-containing protein [Candidatus Dormibacteraeota bacterium]